jgi:hypothetical protein
MSKLATKLMHKPEAGLTPEEKVQKLELAPLIEKRLKFCKQPKLVTRQWQPRRMVGAARGPGGDPLAEGGAVGLLVVPKQ